MLRVNLSDHLDDNLNYIYFKFILLDVGDSIILCMINGTENKSNYLTQFEVELQEYLIAHTFYSVHEFLATSQITFLFNIHKQTNNNNKL